MSLQSELQLSGIQAKKNVRMLGQDVGEKYTHILLVGLQIGASIMESGMNIPQKAWVELPFDPVIPLLNIYPKGLKSAFYDDTATSMLIAVQFTITKLWNQPRYSSTDEETIVHVQNRILFCIKAE